MIRFIWLTGILLSATTYAEIYDTSELRDPTQPYQHKPAKKQAHDIEVDAVIVGDSGSKALIDSQYYTLGDAIDGNQIVAIYHDHVLLNKGKQQVKLYVNKALLDIKASNK